MMIPALRALHPFLPVIFLQVLFSHFLPTSTMPEPEPQPPRLSITSVSQFLVQETFEAHIREFLAQASEYHYFLYVDVPAEWAIRFFENFDERPSS